MVWKIGHGKGEITPTVRGISMLGYGIPENKILGVETSLWARALFVENSDNTLLYLNLELCFPADSIRQGLLERMAQDPELERIQPEDLFITAQHTHSGPSGYCHYPLYNIPTPGFVPQVLDRILEGSMKAIKSAANNSKMCDLEFAKSEFSPELPVAFNRSIFTYKQNVEVQKEGLTLEPAAALDRFMYMLKAKDGGKVFASMNWFGVHCTNIPNFNTKINSDNKGYAADFVEKQMESLIGEHTALFNQTSAADITPNFIWNPEKKQFRGQFEDYIESAKFNGKLQAQKALELIDKIPAQKVHDRIRKAFKYVDMGNVSVDPQFIPAGMEAKNPKTVPGALGTAFMVGTPEGPGAPKIVAFLVACLASLVKLIHVLKSFTMSEEQRKKIWDFYNSQNPKHIFIETGNRRIVGFSDPTSIPIPDFIDPLLKRFRQYYRNGALREHSWTQQVVPVHLVCLGQIALVGLPAEVTTISALRIRRQVLKRLQPMGINEVIVNGYSNGYCGYITTPEEYMTQNYEAGHTSFGKWTLPAFQTVIDDLCEKLLGESQADMVADAASVIFSAKELEARTNTVRLH